MKRKNKANLYKQNSSQKCILFLQFQELYLLMSMSENNISEEQGQKRIDTDQGFIENQYLPLDLGSLNLPMLPDLSNMMGIDPSDNTAMILLQIIQQQSQALQSLNQKVSWMTKKIQELNQKIYVLRNNRNNQNQGQNGAQPQAQMLAHQKPSQNIDSQSLIRILFGSNQQYKYKLRLSKPLDSLLFRERNFSIQICLQNENGEIIQNSNKIPLSLAIYTSENPPKFLQTNTVGQKMVKGYTQQNLHFGVCRFEKIQIREVTSHFRNGWIFIVIIPSMTPLGGINSETNVISYKEIQPLVLDKIIVKAKKIKDSKQEKGKKPKEQYDSEIDQPKSNNKRQSSQNDGLYFENDESK